MAEEVLRATLELGLTPFEQSLRQAVGLVQTFAQQVGQMAAQATQALQGIGQAQAFQGLAQASTQATQAMQGSAQSAQQASTQFTAMSPPINQATAALGTFQAMFQRLREQQGLTALGKGLQDLGLASGQAASQTAQFSPGIMQALHNLQGYQAILDTTAQRTQMFALLTADATSKTQLLSPPILQTMQALQGYQAMLQETAQRQAFLGTLLSDATSKTQLMSPAIMQALHSLEAYKSVAQDAAVRQEAFNRSLLGGALQVAGGLGIATTIGALANQLRSFVTDSVQVAVKMETLQATFRVLSGGAQGAANTLGFLRETGQRLGLDFLALTQSFRGIEAATRNTSLAGEEGRKIFVAFAEAARVLGLSGHELQHILIAVEQMINKGKVSAEELRRQMSNFLPGAFEIAARSIGVTTKELDEMLRKGELMTEQFLPKFAAQIKKELGQGVPDAAQTASAAFARFANNMRDISVTVGEAILTILKPILDKVNAALEFSRKAREEAANVRQEGVGQAPGTVALVGAPDLQARLDAARQELLKQQKILENMNLQFASEQQAGVLGAANRGANRLFGVAPLTQEHIETQQSLIRALEKEYAVLNEQAQRFLAAQEETVAGFKAADAKPFVQQLTHIKDVLKTLDDEMATFQARAKLVPVPKGLSDDMAIEKQLEAAKDALKSYDKALDEASKIVSDPKAKGLRQAIPPEMQQDLNKIVEGHQRWTAEVERLQGALDKLKETEKDKAAAEREALRIQEQRQELLNEMLQGEKFKLRSSDLKDITADTQYFTKALAELADQGGAKANALRTILLELDEAKQKALGTFPTEVFAWLDKITEQFGDEAKQVEDTHKWIERYRAGLDKLHEWADSGGQRVQQQIAKITDEVKKLAKEMGTPFEDPLVQQALTNQLEAQVYAPARKKQEEEIKKLQTAYESLATNIARPFATVFEQILSGTGNLLDTLKQMFIRFLAELAAAAVARAIIIPILLSAVGAGALGLVGAGTAALGGAEFGGGGQGAISGGGAGSVVGTLISLLGAGKTVAGLAGGQNITLSGLLGSLGSTSLGSLLGLGGTSAAAQSVALTAAGTAGGDAGAVLAGTGASQVGILGASLSTIGLGLGAGVAVGLVANWLLKMGLSAIGIEGRTGGTLAGIGAGAAGGAVAGSIIPGIGTAIGAVVGAVIGGIAGYIGGYQAKPPQLDIFRVQPGQVGYDAASGQLVTKQLFEIVDSFARRIKDYQHTLLPQLNNQLNVLFTGIVEGFRGIDPKIAETLVKPLNEIFNNTALLMQSFRDKGSGVIKDLTQFMTTDLPKAVQAWLQPLKDAVARISPIVAQFRSIIDTVQQHLMQLAQEQAQQRLSLEQSIVQIQQGLFSPQQQYAQLWKNLRAGLAMLDTGIGGNTLTGGQQTGASAAERRILIPELQKLVMQIWEAGKQIADAGKAFRSVYDQINQGLITPAEQYQNLQDQLRDLMAQFQTAITPEQRQTLASQIETLVAQIWQAAQSGDVLGQDKAALYRLQGQLLAVLRQIGLGPTAGGGAPNLPDLQAQLTQILQKLQATSDTTYAELQTTLQHQADLAQQQIDLLAASLLNLGSVDSTVQQALQVLQDINGALVPFGGPQQSLATAQVQLALLQAQAQSLGNLERIQFNAAMNLQAINYKMTSHFVGFAEGTPYVPQDMLAWIHQGERIVPAVQNTAMTADLMRSLQRGTAPVVPQGLFGWVNQGTAAAAPTAPRDTGPIVIQVQGNVRQGDLDYVATEVGRRLARRQNLDVRHEVRR